MHERETESFPQETIDELYENAPCGYLFTNPDGIILRTNATFASWLGYTPQELANGAMRFLDLLTVGGKIFYETHFALLLRMHGDVAEIALDFKCKDGRILPSLVSARQKRNATNEPVFNRITIFNTTERRRYEHELLLATRRAEEISAALAKSNAELSKSNAALLKANEALGEFSYAASHDLQEPLRTVAAYAQLLARRYGTQLDNEAHLFLDYIVSGAQRMEALIQDLLSLSQVQGSPGVPRQTELIQPLQAALSNLASAIDESHATVTYEDLPSLVIDTARMTQLFQNLLGNAIKYRNPQEPPRIHVSCRHHENEWVFGVRDNGVGFKKEYAEQVFGMFKRLHGRDVPGTGIGLALCRKTRRVFRRPHLGRFHARSWIYVFLHNSCSGSPVIAIPF